MILVLNINAKSNFKRLYIILNEFKNNSGSNFYIFILQIVYFDQYHVLHSDKIPFDYHNEQLLAKVDYPKGTYIVSLKYFQHVLNKYENPKIGDLVIAEEPDKTAKFKVVEAVPQSYFSEDHGMYYVPNGFVVLRDPESNTTKMVFVKLFRNSLLMYWETTIIRFDFDSLSIVHVPKILNIFISLESIWIKQGLSY